ncbi:MAG: dihydrofolate reductase family protein [Polyangiaceae bacterium]
MSKVRIHGFSVSLDGFGAGADQNEQNPLGKGGPNLHQWFFPTATFQAIVGKTGGTTDVHDAFAKRGIENVGAWILGRNMFGPIRGSWPNDSWRGWWGDNPPYHVPVFILTHHARESIAMEGGTTFHFVTGGVEEALRRAKEAAGEKDVRIGGGVETIRQFLRAGLVDEMHLAFSPVLLGRGEHLLSGIDLPSLGFRVREHVPTEAATHVVFVRERPRST